MRELKISIGSDGMLKNGIQKRDSYNKRAKRIQYLNFGEQDQMQIVGYKVAPTKTYVTWAFYVLSVGLLRLIYHWFPHWELLSTHVKCSLQEADKVLITDNYKGKFKSYFVEEVKTLSPYERSDNLSASMSSIISINGHIYGKKGIYNVTVYLDDGTRKDLDRARIIVCKQLTYVWDEDKLKFVKLIGLDKNVTNNELHNYKGYSKDEQSAKRITYGSNEIFVPVQSVFKLLISETLTPFYMFQLFSLVVWIAEQYYYYTIAIIIMSVCGISTSIIQTRKNQQNLEGTVHSRDTICVCRGGENFDTVPTTDLVPGDLIEIPSTGCEMLCDAVLLNGSCIVNESMLTGESVPVTKTALPKNDSPYNVKEDGNHTLYCGTRIIQTRTFNDEKVLAVVIRTGYLTTKGELVRSILYPPPADFKFDQDSYKFIGILAMIAFLGCIYTIASKYRPQPSYNFIIGLEMMHASRQRDIMKQDLDSTYGVASQTSRLIGFMDTLIKALDLITIAIPPALPAAMTVGKLYALHRLKRSKVFCINSRIINVTGSINCICFDKTGTLTEDGLDMWGVVEIQNSEVKTHIRDISDLSKRTPLFKGMLTCHSLSILDGKLCGDPLEVKMFKSTKWKLNEPISQVCGNETVTEGQEYPYLTVSSSDCLDKSSEEDLVAIIHQFPFVSKLQRMSVVTKTACSKNLRIYCKGSPEMIVSLCKPSTVPNMIDEIILKYTSRGYRVLAMAMQDIIGVAIDDVIKKDRNMVERDLELIGLIIFENKLKPPTTGVINTLKKACLRIIMVTGDNIQTAVSVGRECKMIEENHVLIEVVCTKPTKLNVAQIHYCPFSTKYVRETLNSPNVPDLFEDIEKKKTNKFHLVMTGSSWGNTMNYFPQMIPKIVAKGTIFARMSGQQKQQLVEELKNMGHYVAMCGDGSNDCSALKAANVGISLSEADASVASPFTSKDSNISCVPNIIREGRAALVTSFGVFKFMLCYSLIEFSSAIILYTIDNNLTSLQYLYIDVCLVLCLASFLGKTRASESLHSVPPMTSLLTFVPLTSIVLFMTCNIAFQVFALCHIRTYDWFKPFKYNNTNEFSSYENYAIFCTSTFQYISMAIVFSKGEPYRKPIYTNKILIFCLLFLTFICSYLTVYPAPFLANFLELQLPPHIKPRLTILLTAFINFMTALLIEDLIVDYVVKTKIDPKLKAMRKNRGSNKSFLKILNEINESDWPFCYHSEGSEKKIITYKSVNEHNFNNIKHGVENKGFDDPETEVDSVKI